MSTTTLRLPKPGVAPHLSRRLQARMHARNLEAVLRGSLSCSAFDRKQIAAAAKFLRDSQEPRHP